MKKETDIKITAIELFDANIHNGIAVNEVACMTYVKDVQENPANDAIYKEHHPEFTGSQWNLIWQIGSGVLLPEWWNVHRYSVCNMAAKLTIGEQRGILQFGLKVFVKGEAKYIPVKNLTSVILKKVFTPEGKMRSQKEQEAYDNVQAKEALRDFRFTKKATTATRAGARVTKDVVHGAVKITGIMTAAELKELAREISK